MKRFLRILFYPRWTRKIFYYFFDKKMDKECTKILDLPDYKKVLIMDTIPWGICFKQRPHQLVEFLCKDFDITLYKLGQIKKFIRYNDKIILCPKLYLKKYPEKNIYYYIDSINEYRDFKFLMKLKKMGYKIIYDYIDEFSNQVCDTKNPLKIYKNLEKINPDLIIATSKKLYNNVLKRFPKEKIIFAQNAACPEDFTQIATDYIPPDMKEIVEEGKPIIGYYGVIARWLNYDLLSKAAEVYPDYNFVYIGKDSQLQLQKLKMHKNVFFLGKKEYSELKNYAQYFNCCIIPFNHGNLAKATSPVKLFEYMALKKPIVCTRDLDECRGYEGVLMSENDEEFIKNLALAVELSHDENIKEKLFNCAKANSWEARANNILEGMRNL